MAKRILAVFFVFWVWPGSAEAVEYAAHWLQDGDAVHGERHQAPPPRDDDGCPGPGHLCHLASCACTSTTTPPSTTMPAPPLGPTRAAPPSRVDTCLSCEDPAPPKRPPIA